LKLRTLPFSLVDVFAREPLAGNGLSIFVLDEELPASAMQRITREMRQFETIFLRRTDSPTTFSARIFTMEEELGFAGHPIIGAAALLHSQGFPNKSEVRFEFLLGDRAVATTSRRDGGDYFAEMEQGIAELQTPVPHERSGAFLEALNLTAFDLAQELPIQVVSTGLPYLIVPLRNGLERARIVVADFEARLAGIGAKFVYVLDVEDREGRTWDNDGRVEDIATGSAAGPAAAYLVAHGCAAAGEPLVLKQGRFQHRPSELHAIVRGDRELSVSVRG
jgi:PhzF family phenazine biosynthesis protein